MHQHLTEPRAGRWRHLAFAAVAVAAAATAGCSTSATPAQSVKPVANFQEPGPHPVGITTLDLGPAPAPFGERLATVFYPADPKHLAGHASFSYSESSTLPSALQSILPAKYNTVTSINALVDPPGATTGPFPVVLFSHGFGGERLYYSHLLTGIASWGYVVVSADYLERGLASQALGVSGTSSPSGDTAIMNASLAAVSQADSDPTSPLHGTADPQRVAAVGHSAGGQTAFDELNNPVVSTAIGWAPVAPSGPPSSKPVMLIGALGDSAVPPATVRATYQSFPGKKALVEISGEGHNTYTDICDGIRSGGGLISYAVANHLTSPSLAKLGINGCQASDLPPDRFWPIVQFYTVLQLDNTFHAHPPSVIPAADGRFPGFHVTVTQSAGR